MLSPSCVSGVGYWLPTRLPPLPVAAFDLPHPLQEGLPADELASSKPETGEARQAGHGSVQQIAEVRFTAPEELRRFTRGQNLGRDLKLLFCHIGSIQRSKLPSNFYQALRRALLPNLTETKGALVLA